MMSFFLSGLEKAINAYLHLDAESINRLAKLEGKIIKIEITDWQLEFYIHPQKNGLTLLATEKKEPDAIISGTLFGLCRAGCAKGENTALFKNSISIRGDTELGEEMRDIISGIDIDWEEHASKIVGDTIAHKITVGIHHTKSLGKNTLQTLRENLKDYLQIESSCVPSKNEVEQFISDVTQLQHAVDRAEAKIKRLLKKRNPSA